MPQQLPSKPTSSAWLPAVPLRSSELVRFVPPEVPITGPRTLTQDIALYLGLCKATFSKNTVDNYGRDLRLCEHNLSARTKRPIRTDEITPDALRYHFTILRRDYSPASFERHFYCLKGFFDFVELMRGLRSPMETISKPRNRPTRLPGTLTVEEVSRLCDLDIDFKMPSSRRFDFRSPPRAARLGLDTPEARLRDRAIVACLYATGVRVSELVNLNWIDIDEQSRFVIIHQGKGNKDRLVPISEPALVSLQAWHKVSNPADPEAPIFISFGRNSAALRLSARRESLAAIRPRASSSRPNPVACRGCSPKPTPSACWNW